MSESEWLPIVFISLMGIAILTYAILDGYDLGIGMLLPLDADAENQRDIMIASIGPFWDANETWLVFAVGILLIAFPQAHGEIFQALYIPTAIMLGGLILRGVAFDFREKAVTHQKQLWDKTFRAGSFTASIAQGYMLGMYVMGFEWSAGAVLFSIISALCVPAAYAYIGCGWLILKTEGDLQRRAARWGRRSGWLAAGGIVLVSIVNLSLDRGILEKWFSFPEIFVLFPIPLMCAALFIISDKCLQGIPFSQDRFNWVPLACAASIFFLCFQSLAYSYFPFIVPGGLTIWEAASAPESLKFILVGAVIVVPAIVGYTFFSYRIFWGKATELRYH